MEMEILVLRRIDHTVPPKHTHMNTHTHTHLSQSAQRACTRANTPRTRARACTWLLVGELLGQNVRGRVGGSADLHLRNVLE